MSHAPPLPYRRVLVQQADFDIGAELDALARRDDAAADVGGLASFVGYVRRDKSATGPDDAVRALTLEHYPGMTERQLAAIIDEAAARWPLSGAVILHRVGRLLPGERIVLAACTSAHRDAAFDACRFLMDFLKTRAPFWKREETPQGERWVEARSSDDDAAARWS